MNARALRRLFLLAFLSLAATACGSSTLLAPDCDGSRCGYIPDSGGADDGGYIPDSGGEFNG